MKRFTQVKYDAFKEIQVETGVIMRDFNPANPVIDRHNIICVTSGGITITAKPTFKDYFEDVDNVPNNTKEGKQVESWETSMAFTALDTSAESIKMELGVADIDAQDDTRITPRRDIALTDFMNSIWWVGDRADGGFIACQLLNALSTDGFTLKTTKNGKGTTSVTITGHSSLEAVDTVPMNFYVVEGDSTATSLTLDKASLTVEAGNTATITATKTGTSASISWQSLDTSVATVSDAGVVTAVAAGSTVIIASLVEDDETYMQTCAVTVTGGEG